MAGWCRSGSESDDDEPLNLALFTRKSFGFQGFSEDKDETLRKIVQQLGATCDSYPKYIFTTEEYFKSLTESTNLLYNVSYIRDCVDANRCLSIDQYRFGPKYIKNKDYRDFNPCCKNFHNGQEACTVCDLTYKQEIPVIKETRRSTNRLSQSAETKVIVSNRKKKMSWSSWETQKVLDYIISHKLYAWIKSPSLFKRMEREKVLKRSSESMRVHFRSRVLPNIDTFDLPPPVKKKFKQIRNTPYPARLERLKEKKQKSNNIEA